MDNLYLIGMMGSGKSTIGRLLAARLNRPFVDTDAFIEELNSASVSQIFALKGEPFFRQLETAALQEISLKDGFVVATGGGIVLLKENVAQMKSSGKVIFLDRPVSDIAHDINLQTRPLLKEGHGKLFSIFEKRAALYRDAADIILSGSVTADDAVGKLLSLLKK